MSVGQFNLILGISGAVLSGALILWRRNVLSISVGFIMPLVVVALFWGFHYLRVPQGDSIGSRGWISLFFIEGCLLSYAIAIPILILALLRSSPTPRKKGEQESLP
jgi:hypothetical protein